MSLVARVATVAPCRAGPITHDKNEIKNTPDVESELRLNWTKATRKIDLQQVHTSFINNILFNATQTNLFNKISTFILILLFSITVFKGFAVI